MAAVSLSVRVSGLLLVGLLFGPSTAAAAEGETVSTAPTVLAQAREGGGEIEPPKDSSFFSMDWLFGSSEDEPGATDEGGEAEGTGEPNTKVEIPIAPPLEEQPEAEAAEFDQEEPDETGIVEKNPTRRYSLFGSSDEEEPQEPDETAPELGGEPEPESLALPTAPDSAPAPEVPPAAQDTAPIEAVEEIPLPELPAAVGAQPDQGGSPLGRPTNLLVDETPVEPPAAAAPVVAAPLEAQPESGAGQAPAVEAAPEVKTERLGDALDDLRSLNPVVAVVDGQEIRWAEVLESAGDLPVKYQSQVEAIFPALLDRIIDMKLLTIAARQEGLSANAEVRRRVTDFEDRLLRELYVNQRLGRLVNEEGVRSRYDALVKRLGSKQHLRARHILVETEAEARDLVAVLEAGGDFEALARENSIGPSAERGGDLGYFDPNRMVPQFSEAALAMEVGTYTREPVETPFGWHVIQLIDRRFTGVPPFEEMEASLREQLTQEVMDEILGELRAENEIELFPETPEDQMRRMSAIGTPAAPANETDAAAE